MSDIILRTSGQPFANWAVARQQLGAKWLQDTHDVVPVKGGYGLAPKRTEEPVTLRPGDYVATEGMTEEQCHAVAEAFTAAGAESGRLYQGIQWDFVGWDIDYGVKGWDSGSIAAEKSSRQLTITQVLSATNAKPKQEEEAVQETHLTDRLYAARKARDEAQARYEQVLAEHREAYPWLVVEEKVVPAEDMSNWRNWREGGSSRANWHRSR